MKRLTIIKHLTAYCLLLVILATCLLPAASAATGTKIRNSGTRDEVCTALSAQAEAYYTGTYSYEHLKTLRGAQDATGSYAATQNNPLYTTLSALMSDTQTEYYSYSSLSKDFAYTDTQNGAREETMSCLWAGRTAVWDGSYFNREHVWPKSHASFYQQNGGADRHHLRPTSATINQNVHKHRPYGTATGGTLVYDEVGNPGGRYNSNYYEPNDNVKGDTARILLYVYVRWQQPNLYSDVAERYLPAYDDDDDANDGLRVIESLDTLLAWCELDPVDTWEMGRNDAAERIQGNRNVFIDYPELAWLMFGKEIPAGMPTPSGGSGCAHESTQTVGGVPATCTDDGYSGDVYCTECGAKLKEGQTIAALGHAWNAGVVTVQPTETEEGVRTFTCTRCQATRTEAIPCLTHTHSYTAVVTEPTCTDKGYTTHTCACGDSYKNAFTDALGHAWDAGVMTAEPTATQDGTKTYTCTRCKITKTERIPATGEDKPCDGGANCPSQQFTDVNATKWYHSAVDFAVTRGLFNGTGDGHFSPENSMTRAMLVTVLWRYEGEPHEGENAFADVPEGQWYTDAVAWAAANGVVNGVGNGKFDPNGNVTREQMVTILFRYCGDKGFDTSARANIGSFPDAGNVSAYAKASLEWAVAQGIVNGSGGYLLPQGNATRAQVAAVLMRFIQNIAEA